MEQLSSRSLRVCDGPEIPHVRIFERQVYVFGSKQLLLVDPY